MTQYFEINGEELELKITWEGAKRLNDYFDGGEDGALAVVGKAIQGDLETIPKVVQCALLHTGKRFSLKTIEEAIAVQVDEEKVDLYDLMKMVKETVADSFFYKKAMNKMLQMNGEQGATQALEAFYKDTE